MNRVYNFSAGPAIMPESVLRQAQAEMLDWKGTGMSVMEMSHRGEHFLSIAAQTERDLRDLLQIPEHYSVLFIQGGASLQFSMLAMNLSGQHRSMDYVDTGDWSLKAIAAAQVYGKVNIVASSRAQNYTDIPTPTTWNCDPNAAYLHYTPNETIRGVEFHHIPSLEQAPSVPLVADMSSTLLSRPIDINRFGMIYAGAQKNIGPAGLTLVIIRQDLLERSQRATALPNMLNYAVYDSHDSMMNTPPTYTWYLAGLVLQWIKAQGGLTAMALRNERKAQHLYHTIDELDFYHCPVAPHCRSWMNVPFTLQDNQLDKLFLTQAAEQGMVSLKGHRDIGGMRASLYNAMPEQGVIQLTAFMRDFAKRYA